MEAPKDTRPFDLEHAKAGAPYGCRNGYTATILKWDGRTQQCELIGCIGEKDQAITWRKDGMSISRDLDLVMLPLGYIDGKPVFVGDEVVMTMSDTLIKAHPLLTSGHLAGCRWPAPAKVYPETRMSGNELEAVFSEYAATHFHDQTLAAVANAALRHAVVHSDLILPDVHQSVVLENMGLKADRAARDMAIAKAVLGACLRAASDAPNLPTFCNMMKVRDLAAIIAKVPA